MKVAGELVHQGCPLPWAAEEQCCPAPMRHHMHSNFHAQMAFELKKNPFLSIFRVSADGWLTLVLGVRAGFCPQSLKLGGCVCLAVSPFLQHSEPVSAVHKSALGCLETRLGPACCKYLPKQNITQLKGAYCVPVISPCHSSIMSGFPGWELLELEEVPTHCKLSLCASSLLHKCCSPLCGNRQCPLLPSASGTHFPINTTTFLLRSEYKTSWGVSDKGSISLEHHGLPGGDLRSLECL